MTKGIKFDGEKPDYSLVPPFALEHLADLLTKGAKKYAPNNWQKVKPKKRYYAAAARHLTQYLMAVLRGDKSAQYDDETGIHHLICVACNAMFLYEHETVYSADEPFYGTQDSENAGPTISRETLDKLVERVHKPQSPMPLQPYAPPVPSWTPQENNNYPPLRVNDWPSTTPIVYYQTHTSSQDSGDSISTRVTATNPSIKCNY